MSEVKPVAGQWYAEGESRFYCVGISTDGCFVFQSSNGYSFAYHKDDAKKLTHLPDCTGWDWQPETFPQYWKDLRVNMSRAFHKRTAVDKAVIVFRDGKEKAWEYPFRVESGMKQITEVQALALLDPKPQPGDWAEDAAHENGKYQNRCFSCGNMFVGHKRRVQCKVCHDKPQQPADVIHELRVKIDALETENRRLRTQPQLKVCHDKPQPAKNIANHLASNPHVFSEVQSRIESETPVDFPAEDPEEWVDLPKDHRIRAEIDWYDYGGVFDYVCKGSTLIGVRVGDTQAKKARCRRKDLPKPAKPKRTVTVPKWLCFSSSTGWSVVEQENEPSSYNAVHRVGETTYTEQEDGTWIES